MLKIEKYFLAPLKSIQKEDFSFLFKNLKGIYLCNYPEEDWYIFNNFKRLRNYSIEKKKSMFELMDNDAVILSATGDYDINMPSRGFVNNRIIHFGSLYFTGRFAQLFQIINIIVWLFKNRQKYDYILIYNFYLPQFLAAIFCKYILGKKLYIDFEDDYTLLKRNKFKNILFTNILANMPDAVICIHSNMKRYFKVKTKTIVFNGFINLEYTKKINFEFTEEMVFMYSSTLDEIRGADLIPELVIKLREKIRKFQIIITGTGPLDEMVREIRLPEVKYMGFIEKEQFEKILASCDACLVLQKPDNEFSMGSFPSKIEYYAKWRKPIYHLKL